MNGDEARDHGGRQGWAAATDLPPGAPEPADRASADASSADRASDRASADPEPAAPDSAADRGDGAPRPGPANALTDVTGLRVGHAQRVGDGWLTGTTVVLAPEGGAVAAVDVRGGGPGTRETDALDPRNLVQRVEAVVLTGGSAYGLDTAGGVMAWLEEQGRGFPVGAPGQVVPVVPAAALFDLGRGGDWRARPDRDLGRAAVEAAAAQPEGGPVPQGCVGAGTGAVAGRIKGGIGTASVRLPSGVTVAALAAVNCAGSVFDPDTGALWGARPSWAAEFGYDGTPLPRAVRERARRLLAGTGGTSFHTTLAVVATDATLTRAQAHKLAGTAHDGLARAVNPVHLLSDGDTVFALSTARRPLLPPEAAPTDPAFGVHLEAGALNAVLAAGADTLTRAVLHAVLTAHGTPDFPSYRDLFDPGPAS